MNDWFNEGPTATMDAGLGDNPDDWTRRKPGPRQFGRIRVLSVDDLLHSTPRDYIIKGWISPAEISLIVGAKNTRKSFLGLHSGYAVSQGRYVFGRRVKQASVLYIIAEGEKGIGKRVDAQASHYGRSPAFNVIAQPVDLLRRTADVDDLQCIIDAVQAYKAGWVIIDTVNRVMPGGKENSPEDMGMFLHNINLLRHETGAHITGIHHGTKDDGTDSRGHSSLPNGADVVLGVEWKGDGNGLGIATLDFARDDKTGPLGTFQTEEVTLGTDEDGDPVTTLLVNEMDPGMLAHNASRPDTKGLLPKQQHMLDVFHNTLARQGVPVVPLPEMPPVTGLLRSALREALIEAGWFPEDAVCEGLRGPQIRKPGPTLENNALTGLKSRKFLAFNREYVWQI
jgi:AAA domain-containing protein